MKINSTDRYLSLLLRTLEEKIAPELTSSSAQAAAQMMGVTLTELLKREHEGTDILRQCIVDGRVLLHDVNAVLGVEGQSIEESSIEESSIEDTVVASNADLAIMAFSALEKPFNSITDQLALASEALVSSALSKDKISALLLRVAEWELAYYQQKAKMPAPTLPIVATQGKPLSAELFEAYLNSQRGYVGGHVDGHVGGHVDGNTDGNFTLTNFESLPGGFGKQTFLCEYTNEKGIAGDVVIRKTDPSPIMQQGRCFLESECDLLRTLATIADYPAPKPIDFVDQWQDVDGSFYTMARAQGTTPGSFLEGVAGEIDKVLLLELAELLGRLHSIPLETFSEHIVKYNDPRILTGSTADAYRYNLESWAHYMEKESHLASPYVTWLFHWLNNNIPKETGKPVLVHGDFNVHNVLVDKGKVTAVLDWECADFGAPEQDLAYIKPNIEGLIEWSTFIEHYQAHGGKQELNPEAMRFGTVYSALRTNLAGNRGTYNLQSGRNLDLRYIMVELGFTESFMGVALNNAK